jgi:glycosyltransferase involved in cell wall biosynthesis
MPSRLPTVSIVTCSYMQGCFIDATIRSVLNQGYPHLEYIIIDGGSTDETVDVIRRHADRLAYWVSEKDSGQTDALMKGFQRATGEIQGWLCSDDLLLPNALQTVGQYFADHPEVDFVFGDALWIDAQGHALRPKKEMQWSRFTYLFDHNYLAQPSCFWRKSLFERAGGLDRSLHLAMDSDLWLRFANLTTPRHLPHYLSCMRYYPEQKTRALKPAGRKEDDMLRRREAPLLATAPRLLTRTLARALRLVLKAKAGGYLASTPQAVLPWLSEHQIR